MERWQGKIGVRMNSDCEEQDRLTDLDIAASVQEHIVRFDITVDDIRAMKMRKSFAGL